MDVHNKTAILEVYGVCNERDGDGGAKSISLREGDKHAGDGLCESGGPELILHMQRCGEEGARGCLLEAPM